MKTKILAVLTLFLALTAFAGPPMKANIVFHNCEWIALTPWGGPGSDQYNNSVYYEVFDGEQIQLTTAEPVPDGPNKPGFELYLYEQGGDGLWHQVSHASCEMSAGSTTYSSYVSIIEDIPEITVQLPQQGYGQ